MDFVISGIKCTIEEIITTLELKKSNNEDAKKYKARIKSINTILSEVDVLTNTTESALKALESHLGTFQNFINKLDAQDTLGKLWNARDNAKKFNEFNQDLTDLIDMQLLSNSFDIIRTNSLLAKRIDPVKEVVDVTVEDVKILLVKASESEDHDIQMLEQNRQLIYDVTAIKQMMQNQSESTKTTSQAAVEVIYKKEPIKITFIKESDISTQNILELADSDSSQVFKVQWQGIFVAVKRLKSVPFRDPESSTFKSDAESTNKAILKEVKALEILQKSPFVIRYFGCTSIGRQLGLVTEYLNNGTLFEWLYKKDLPREHEENIQLGIARGFSYIHECEIAHNDVKSSNIMLDSLFLPRIIGLSMSKIINTSTKTNTEPAFLGTAQWRSPECWDLDNTVDIRRKLPYVSDVYSFGVLLGEFYKVAPWEELKNIEIKKKVLAGERPYKENNIPNDVYAIMEKCWKQGSDERIEMKEVVELLKNK